MIRAVRRSLPLRGGLTHVIISSKPLEPGVVPAFLEAKDSLTFPYSMGKNIRTSQLPFLLRWISKLTGSAFANKFLAGFPFTLEEGCRQVFPIIVDELFNPSPKMEQIFTKELANLVLASHKALADAKFKPFIRRKEITDVSVGEVKYIYGQINSADKEYHAFGNHYLAVNRNRDAVDLEGKEKSIIQVEMNVQVRELFGFAYDMDLSDLPKEPHIIYQSSKHIVLLQSDWILTADDNPQWKVADIDDHIGVFDRQKISL